MLTAPEVARNCAEYALDVRVCRVFLCVSVKRKIGLALYGGPDSTTPFGLAVGRWGGLGKTE